MAYSRSDFLVEVSEFCLHFERIFEEWLLPSSYFTSGTLIELGGKMCVSLSLSLSDLHFLFWRALWSGNTSICNCRNLLLCTKSKLQKPQFRRIPGVLYAHRDDVAALIFSFKLEVRRCARTFGSRSGLEHNAPWSAPPGAKFVFL